MTVALGTSLLLALTWTPTLSLYLVRRKETAVRGRFRGPDMAVSERRKHTFRFFWSHCGLLRRIMRAPS